jgi:hypothetical protein
VYGASDTREALRVGPASAGSGAMLRTLVAQLLKRLMPGERHGSNRDFVSVRFPSRSGTARRRSQRRVASRRARHRDGVQARSYIGLGSRARRRRCRGRLERGAVHGGGDGRRHHRCPQRPPPAVAVVDAAISFDMGAACHRALWPVRSHRSPDRRHPRAGSSGFARLVGGGPCNRSSRPTSRRAHDSGCRSRRDPVCVRCCSRSCWRSC